MQVKNASKIGSEKLMNPGTMITQAYRVEKLTIILIWRVVITQATQG